ncbi:uncharacterized protein [Asterias amurensis]|uniref:uncharacterized protein n=1 Tax=Asterias amurensis TaxID=7602 RepID=UPI003AB35756
MFRFLAITVAVCSLFVQDAQATAVASNTRREIEVELEEELLRSLLMERSQSGCLAVSEVSCSLTACYFQMAAPFDDIFAEVSLRRDGSIFFAVDTDAGGRVVQEKVPEYDVKATHESKSFVINGQDYKLKVGVITPGRGDTNMEVANVGICN